MKQQILFVHGGHASSTPEEYLDNLRTSPLKDIFSDFPKRWHQDLRNALGDAYEVCTPQMPNKYNADYEEWKIWFERHLELFQDDVILIGHSLGGIFIAKYLTENVSPVRIKALFFVAAVISYKDRRMSGSSSFSFDLSRLPTVTNKVSEIHIYHSTDDAVVPFEHALQYHEALEGSRLHSFKDKGHFLQEEFPELVLDIKSLV